MNSLATPVTVYYDHSSARWCTADEFSYRLGAPAALHVIRPRCHVARRSHSVLVTEHTGDEQSGMMYTGAEAEGMPNVGAIPSAGLEYH